MSKNIWARTKNFEILELIAYIIDYASYRDIMTLLEFIGLYYQFWILCWYITNFIIYRGCNSNFGIDRGLQFQIYPLFYFDILFLLPSKSNNN